MFLLLIWLFASVFLVFADQTAQRLDGSRVRGFATYGPEIYPDSQLDFGICRLIEPSLVCDPNFVLNQKNGTDGIIALHDASAHILFHTNCSCSGFCRRPSRGYAISVAILRKIQNYTNRDETLSFGSELRIRLQRSGGRGQCDDDVLIIYAADDDVLMTFVGSGVSEKLPPSLVSEIESFARQRFLSTNDPTGALLLMIEAFGRILNGDQFVHPLPHDLRPSEAIRWPLWIIVGVPFILILLFLLFAFFVGSFQRRHYTPGHRRE